MARVLSAAKWAERVEWLKANKPEKNLIERAEKAYNRRKAEEAWMAIRQKEAAEKRRKKLRERLERKARKEHIYVSIKTNEIPDPPCVRFACPHIESCGARLMACESFHHYVNEGRLIPPDLLDGPTVERHADIYRVGDA